MLGKTNVMFGRAVISTSHPIIEHPSFHLLLRLPQLIPSSEKREKKENFCFTYEIQMMRTTNPKTLHSFITFQALPPATPRQSSSSNNRNSSSSNNNNPWRTTSPSVRAGTSGALALAPHTSPTRPRPGCWQH